MYGMKRYTVAMVRERLAEALDEAERGVPVVIERRGIRYVLRAETAQKRRPRRRPSLLEIVDPSVAEGQWHWTWTSSGLRFGGRRSRR
jgi:antitoxin (DNA-binding transcriptional repressor) of toxin-antitoxin stability system